MISRRRFYAKVKLSQLSKRKRHLPVRAKKQSKPRNNMIECLETKKEKIVIDQGYIVRIRVQQDLFE